MKQRFPRVRGAAALAASALAAVVLVSISTLPAARAAEMRRMSRAELEDRIRGGWAGQMIGVSYGAPTEFRSNGRILEEKLEWTPDRVSNALEQDDLYVEMTFMSVLDRLGLKASSKDFGLAFRDSKYRLWHANAGARRALNQGVMPPWSGHPKYNIHANDIDFQIESDFIGLLNPGMPRAANRLCEKVGRVMNYGDGLYGGMFVGGMYSAAFFESNPRNVVEAGLACIPARSGYALLIRDLLDLSAREPNDWRKVWAMIESKWDRNDPCPDGAMDAFNIDARLNGGYIAFGLLYGGGDMLKTMEISTRCGQDSDCNPSSAAGVLGTMLGLSRIPDVCKSGLPAIAAGKFEFTDYSFDAIVASSLKHVVEAIRSEGGKVTDTEVLIPLQTPRPPKLEQWDPGIPDKQILAGEPAWTWKGAWKDVNKEKTSATAGDEATLTFEGVAVVLLGPLDQSGGRADVFIDGRRVGIADAFIPDRTYDHCIWHAYGLKPGSHTLRVVSKGAHSAQSAGNRFTITHALTYRPRSETGAQ